MTYRRRFAALDLARVTRALRRGPASGRVLLAMVALLLVAQPLARPGSALAQAPEAPPLEILAVEHDPAGRLLISVRAGASREAVVDQYTVVIDQIPQQIEPRDTERRERASIVFAIDTSGGRPLDRIAAREAARELVQGLSDEERVALLAFAGTPTLLQGFSTDRDAFLAFFDQPMQSGLTSLYDSMAVAADLLADEDGASRVMILLSHHGDFGGESLVGRDESIRALVDAGVTVYAIGFGPHTDREYLETLAAETAGGDWHFDDDQQQALAAVFGLLGGQLGAAEELRVAVPPMRTGEHEVTVRARVDGVPATATARFTVTNDGLISPSVVPGDEPDAPIVVRLSPVAPPASLDVRATLDGEPLAVDRQAGEVIVDPWRAAPGQGTVEIEVLVGGQVAAVASVPIEVPALEPRLAVDRSAEEGVLATARGRAQGGNAAIVALSGDTEVARTSSSLLTVPDGAATGLLVFRLIQDGEVLAEETLDIAAPVAAEGGFNVGLLLLLLVAGGGIAYVVIRRRRRNAAAPREPEVRPIVRRREPIAVAPPAAPVLHGSIEVLGPSGEARRIPVAAKPLTIGSSPNCDIVVEGEGVRRLHARVTPIGRGEVRLHAISDTGHGRPYLDQAQDDWVVLSDGEQISIGAYTLRFALNGAGAPPGAPAASEAPRWPSDAAR